MRYVPSLIPEKLPQTVRSWLADELRKLAGALSSVDNLSLVESNAAPEKIADGQVIYADGTNWNPGDGEGIYGRYNSAWNKLAGSSLTGYTQASVDENITGQWDFQNSGGIRIYDAGGTDFAKMYHSGVSFLFDFTNTANLTFNGLSSGVLFNDGIQLKLGNPAGTTLVTMEVNSAKNWNIDATDGAVDAVNINYIGFSVLWVRDGATLRVSDASDVDDIETSHDGIDAIHNYNGTTDVLFQGATDYKLDGNSIANSDETTGGSGSAGAGNQYVELVIAGTTYKVLHDGTV